MPTHLTGIRLVYDRCVYIKLVYIRQMRDWYTTDAYTQIKTDIYEWYMTMHACNI